MMWFVMFLVLLLVLYYLFPPIRICGDSMRDTYHDGEIIFGTRLFKRDNLKSGDIVVYRVVKGDKRVVIKRISKTTLHYNKDIKLMYCLGDNPNESYDSRNYGYVPVSHVVCKIINPRKKKERYLWWK